MRHLPDVGDGHSLESVCSASLGLIAALALPDANNCAFHGELAAEAAEVLRVLANFDLLDLLTQAGAVARAVLADDSDLLRALRLQSGQFWAGETKAFMHHSICTTPKTTATRQPSWPL